MTNYQPFLQIGIINLKKILVNSTRVEPYNINKIIVEKTHDFIIMIIYNYIKTHNFFSVANDSKNFSKILVYQPNIIFCNLISKTFVKFRIDLYFFFKFFKYNIFFR